MAEKNTADIGFEKQIWDAACVLRGNMDASEYKSVVLGLIFLKYISDRFTDKYDQLVADGDGFEEDRDEYTSEGIFFVPAGARWNEVAAKAHDPEIGQVTTLDFIPMAKLRYIPLIVRVTPDTTNTELYLKIAHEIEQRGNDNIFRFKVQGMRDPDISFDLDALKLRFRIADIIDETEPQYDFSALFAEHPSDMIGFYIQALKKPDMSPVEKKALFYGIHALLLTTDERS